MLVVCDSQDVGILIGFAKGYIGREAHINLFVCIGFFIVNKEPYTNKKVDVRFSSNNTSHIQCVIVIKENKVPTIIKMAEMKQEFDLIYCTSQHLLLTCM